MQILKPETLAWWTRLLRETQHLSQEALAAACELNTRTIQRIESAEPSTITTRRALARGLGYDKLDTFEDPQVALSIENIRAEIDRIGQDALKEQFPDRVRIPAQRVRTGEQLGRLVEMSNACAFHYDDALKDESKSVAATIFDYLRDYADVDDCCSATEKLAVYKELGAMLRELEGTGVAAHSGLRAANIVGRNWQDKTPLSMNIAYFVVDVADKEIQEIWAGKQFQFGC
jgi:transcriptional regulator with XRE-family HTH domain